MSVTAKVGENRREDFTVLEARIESAFVPVPPRAEYVRELKQRLLSENDIEIAVTKPGGRQSIIWTAAGLLSGTLILVLGVRAVITLLNSRGFIQQIKNQMQPKNAAPLNPAV
jgi:hypothetical protein